MTVGAPLDPADVEAFRGVVERAVGLHFDDSRRATLADLFARRLAARKLSPSAYLMELAAGQAPAEWRELARELTVNETYFFRHLDQLRAFVDVAVPARVAARRHDRVLRILSAGCASGEEPYSLAMLLREADLGPDWSVSIRAVDLSRAMLDRAARGRYSSWALRETPEAMRRRWFTDDGREAVLDPALRASVTFEERNLAVDDPALWPFSYYDVVFCRNVLMYFAPERTRAAIARIAQSLAPGGFFFMGHAENLRGVSDAFTLRTAHGTFFYSRRDDADPRPDPAPDPGAPAPAWRPAPAVETDPRWFDAIHEASARIRALTDAVPAAREEAAASAPAIALAPALELLERERYAEALASLERLPPDDAAGADAMLLRAALLVHGGRVTEAETLGGDLAAVEPHNAGARYVLGLCREGVGDLTGAAVHHRAASQLDPTFAMPRLHLGLMARRAGDPVAASVELSEALHLLASEDPSRLRLFGGGFGREGLAALCRLELAGLGGRP